jgi:glutaredoxin
MIRVTLYSRPACHLCELVERVLHHVAGKRPFELEIRNIEQNADDLEKYRNDIPVVIVNGREIARHKLTAAALEAALDCIASVGIGEPGHRG